MTMSMEMGRQSLPVTAIRRVILVIALESAWWVLTFQFRFRSPSTVLVVGSVHSLGITICTGPEGVRFYTRMKTLTSRWPSGIKEGAVFNFKAGGEH